VIRDGRVAPVLPLSAHAVRGNAPIDSATVARGAVTQRVPRLVAGADVTVLPLGPREGFVLSRIDGQASVTDISDLTGVDAVDVLGIVDRLVADGVCEWHDGPATRPQPIARARPSDAAASSAPARPVATKPPPPGTARTLYDPVELEEDCDIDADRRRRILDTFYRLDELDFYDVLGIAQDAEKKDVRAAYFALSKVFHPDTLFGKRLGSYKQKMEAVFKRLTEAYDVLGKARSRAEYDAYLSTRRSTYDDIRSLDTGARQAAAIEKVVRIAPDGTVTVLAAPTPPPPAPDTTPGRAAVTPPPPSEGEPREMSEEGKQRTREATSKRIAAVVGRAMPSGPGDAAAPSTPPEPAPPDKDHVLRGLASSLRAAAVHTGGIDRVQRHLDAARKSETDGNLIAAANSLRLAVAISGGRPEIKAEFERVTHDVAVSQAGNYEKMAGYEEKNRKWADAALSWSRVTEGRPDDPVPHVRAAECLVEAHGDMHRAKLLAQRAVDLAPESFAARRALGRVFFTAGMKLNAKRELEVAAKLDPADELVKNLLHELRK
jgi:hypothetical protein